MLTYPRKSRWIKDDWDIVLNILLQKYRRNSCCSKTKFHMVVCTLGCDLPVKQTHCPHYDDVIMTTMASQVTSLTVVYSIVYSDADQRKHQSSASLAFVWGIHRDRWIPRTKGQLRGKCFHLMTSSCPGRFQWNFLNKFQTQLMSEVYLAMLPLGDCRRTLMVVRQYVSGDGLTQVYRHRAPVGHTE